MINEKSRSLVLHSGHAENSQTYRIKRSNKLENTFRRLSIILMILMVIIALVQMKIFKLTLSGKKIL